jgi:hypothetical protein
VEGTPLFESVSQLSSSSSLFDLGVELFDFGLFDLGVELFDFGIVLA